MSVIVAVARQLTREHERPANALIARRLVEVDAQTTESTLEYLTVELKIGSEMCQEEVGRIPNRYRNL